MELIVSASPSSLARTWRPIAYCLICIVFLIAAVGVSWAESAVPITSSIKKIERQEKAGQNEANIVVPHIAWTLPFVLMLLSIAVLPIIPRVAHWWEKNRNRLAVALILSGITCVYYLFRHFGYHHAPPGFWTLGLMLKHAIFDDYLPFITLLFSLYVIAGGIAIQGDIPARPLTNTFFLAIGALIASIIGTTGVAMLLIRPLLRINRQRTHVRHTVIFFIFVVCNIGGCLLPVGDPPLFLGYLRGVPFLWTLKLLPQWAFSISLLLFIYFVWDSIAWRREPVAALNTDEKTRIPITIQGRRNLIYLAGVVLAIALLTPGRPFLGTSWRLPNILLREIVLVALAILSLRHTPRRVRAANDFNFLAIVEVACLFIGIFITMQVPIEILSDIGPALGLRSPWQFFWTTGFLSSFLDNAPTYVVFFELAKSIPTESAELIQLTRVLPTITTTIPAQLLAAVSCGAVFMGANTYIGNGPNFMVRSIAHYAGVPMPGFLGYMLYSTLILIPVFLLTTWVFFV